MYLGCAGGEVFCANISPHPRHDAAYSLLHQCISIQNGETLYDKSAFERSLNEVPLSHVEGGLRMVSHARTSLPDFSPLRVCFVQGMFPSPLEVYSSQKEYVTGMTRV